jgi:predicted Rdx family selenoprotein
MDWTLASKIYKRGFKHSYGSANKMMQFAQELLSTFNTDLGEVALVPMTGGVFTVTMWHAGPETALEEVSTQETILWDRKRDGGFPGKSSHKHKCISA